MMEPMIKRAAALIPEARRQVPLVHLITNYVTVNDCANITLAAGGSPIMADDIAEVAEITSAASALVLNIGTLNARTIASMLASGQAANQRGIPVIFDPVGAGASKLRDETAAEIIKRIRLAVIRGNLSEISWIAGLGASARGVDAAAGGAGKEAAAIAKETAARLGCVIAVTGAADVISDGKRVVTLRNGHQLLSRVTGTGCMATALVGAYAGVTDDYLAAAAAGIAAMGIAGEIAYDQAGRRGTGSFRAAIIDAVSLLTQQTFETRGKLHER